MGDFGCLLVAAFWKMDWGTGNGYGVLWRKLLGNVYGYVKLLCKLIN